MKTTEIDSRSFFDLIIILTSKIFFIFALLITMLNAYYIIYIITYIGKTIRRHF